MSEARNRLVEAMFRHRAVDTFDCACGWQGDGFGDPYRRHLLDIALSETDEDGELLILKVLEDAKEEQ